MNALLGAPEMPSLQAGRRSKKFSAQPATVSLNQDESTGEKIPDLETPFLKSAGSVQEEVTPDDDIPKKKKRRRKHKRRKKKNANNDEGEDQEDGP